jgi:putative transposase
MRVKSVGTPFVYVDLVPRKKLLYTHLYPYHVRARANNRDWFYLPKSGVWRVMVTELFCIFAKYRVLPHAFVLMDNHYHMILTVDEAHYLGRVMCDLQKSVSRSINLRAGRINHVFGGPYKASLISSEVYYARVLRYIYQNPIRAGLSVNAEGYPYSTLNNSQLGICSPISGIASLIPSKDFIGWVNEPQDSSSLKATKAGLRKTVFRPISTRSY